MTNITVTCCRCRKDHKGFSEGQAEGCAADVHEDDIHGHYGSSVADMTSFVYKDPALPGSELTVGGHICDDCLNELIAQGRIVERPHVARPATSEFREELARDFGIWTEV